MKKNFYFKNGFERKSVGLESTSFLIKDILDSLESCTEMKKWHVYLLLFSFRKFQKIKIGELYFENPSDDLLK